jgi:hypothetical protein
MKLSLAAIALLAKAVTSAAVSKLEARYPHLNETSESPVVLDAHPLHTARGLQYRLVNHLRQQRLFQPVVSRDRLCRPRPAAGLLLQCRGCVRAMR